MSFVIVVTLFLLGAISASFMGVIVARLSTGQSFLTGRSRCDACNVPLPPFSLIPIFSYLTSCGRAGCCGARTSLYAPATEVLLGGLFVLAYNKLGFTITLLGMLISLSLLLALVLYDLRHQILPLPFLVLFVLTSAATDFVSAGSLDAFYTNVGTALLIATSLGLIHVLSRGRAMGFADAPLALGLALLTGSVAFTGFVFSFWIGAIIGILLLLQRPAGSRMGVEVPFAPFLAAGFLLAYFTQWNLFIFVAGLQ